MVRGIAGTAWDAIDDGEMQWLAEHFSTYAATNGYPAFPAHAGPRDATACLPKFSVTRRQVAESEKLELLSRLETAHTGLLRLQRPGRLAPPPPL